MGTGLGLGADNGVVRREADHMPGRHDEKALFIPVAAQQGLQQRGIARDPVKTPVAAGGTAAGVVLIPLRIGQVQAYVAARL